MPLGEIEREVLRSIAANRHPDSFVAGATVLHQDARSPRASQDIDLFHGSKECLVQAVEADLATLTDAGFEVAVLLRQTAFVRAQVSRGGQNTKIEWAQDSVFRFFPIEPDVELGWRLNFWDAATNKVIALCDRAKLRDLLDALYLHEHHLHLGALIWAAAGKDPGLTPEMMILYARRFARYREEDVREVQLTYPLDLRELKMRWIKVSEDANALFPKLPPSEIGCLYLDSGGRPVRPDPAGPEFARLTRHFGSVKGAWPRIAEE